MALYLAVRESIVSSGNSQFTRYLQTDDQAGNLFAWRMTIQSGPLPPLAHLSVYCIRLCRRPALPLGRSVSMQCISVLLFEASAVSSDSFSTSCNHLIFLSYILTSTSTNTYILVWSWWAVEIVGRLTDESIFNCCVDKIAHSCAHTLLQIKCASWLSQNVLLVVEKNCQYSIVIEFRMWELSRRSISRWCTCFHPATVETV